MSRRVQPLEDAYFEWLCEPFDERMDIRLDDDMLRLMHQTPFKYWVPNDQNRALDGKELRDEFFYYMPVKSSPAEVDGWRSLECSMLEMLIALADRAAYQTGDTMTDWFMTFLRNLGLPASLNKTKLALRRLNKRSYSWDGAGGLFPLKHPIEDQTTVELWYQMSAYIIENYDGEGV